MPATYVAVAAGEQLLIEIETATAGTYAAPALINAARALNMSAAATATDIPRTDNPSAPAMVARAVTNTDWKVSGGGVLNTGDDLIYANWLASGLPKNVRVSNATTGGLVLVGPGVLTAFSITGDRGKKQDCTLSIDSAGIFTTTAHA